MAKKLFGNASKGGKFSAGRGSAQPELRPEQKQGAAPASARPSGKRNAPVQKKKDKWKTLKVVLSVLLCLEILYCIAIFSDIPFIKKLRNMYIETAMSTMSHHWLAEAFIPQDIVNEVVENARKAQESQIGHNSEWNIATTPTTEPQVTEPPVEVTAPTETEPQETTRPYDPKEDEFYEMFWEVDPETMEDYIRANPDVLAEGWDKIKINEAGLDDKGTSIETIHGDQVLAIDAENQIILIRVKGSTYRGVLSISKKPENLLLGKSKGLGGYGQRVGQIAETYDGLVAVTASGFVDPDGKGTGGEIAGYAYIEGRGYGKHYGWGYKRLELHEDNRLYITDAPRSVSKGTTDAMEFQPALIVDGKVMVDEKNFWNAVNPRACVGQTSKEEIMMLVIEGRRLDSAGTGVAECAEILARYDCYQAMNMDGGTSAIMWYDGEYVTHCSNPALEEGRHVPNAWVVTK